MDLATDLQDIIAQAAALIRIAGPLIALALVTIIAAYLYFKELTHQK